jgi:hypothetical protein
VLEELVGIREDAGASRTAFAEHVSVVDQSA